MRDKHLPAKPDDPRLDSWYHTIELGDGLVSKGKFDHRSVVDNYGIPVSLRGKTVLDVATGDGFWAFELERRGADRVVAIDVPRMGDCDWLPRMRSRIGDAVEWDPWPTHFRLAHKMRRSKVEYRFCSVYDLSPYTVGMFDVVFCGSLLVHLQNPLQALLAIRSVTREMAIIETVSDPRFEDHPDLPLLSFGFPGTEEQAGENNSYWLTSTAALAKMLEYSDFAAVRPGAPFDLPPSGPRVSTVVALTQNGVLLEAGGKGPG